MRTRRIALICLALCAATLGQAVSAASAGDVPRRRLVSRLIRPAVPKPGGWASLHRDLRASARPHVQTENFRVLAHTKLSVGPPWADVFFYDYGGPTGKYAFVGTWSYRCAARGVQIVDVNDPRAPKVVAVAGGHKRVSREDVVVRRIGGRDILAMGLQHCGFGGRSQDPVGLKLFDVTDPAHPQALSLLELEELPFGGVHELDVVVRADGRALALLAVPFAEAGFQAEPKGEFRIVDITDPTNPVELADWGIIGDSSLRIFGGNDEISNSGQGLGSFNAHFAHSARAADGGTTAYVSYWDGGVLKFDISDPSDPVLLGRTGYSKADDGDAHSMTPFDHGGTRYILQNDEDVSSTPSVLVSWSGGDTSYPGVQQEWAPAALSRGSGVLTGDAFDAEDGCRRADFRGAKHKVVLFNAFISFYGGHKPHCKFGSQVVRAVRAGAKAVLVNMVWPEDPNSFYPFPRTPYGKIIKKEAKDVPILQVTKIDEIAAGIRSGLGAGDVKVTLRAQTPSQGFLRVFDEGSASDVDGDGTPEYEQVGRFADLLHVRGEAKPPCCEWSIHNTEVNGDRAYSSWYEHGVVALDMSDPTSPELAGQFVPPGSFVWGVAVDPETGLVYASDIGSGLWIIRPTGAAAPGG
jgi:hypothetical protein